MARKEEQYVRTGKSKQIMDPSVQDVFELKAVNDPDKKGATSRMMEYTQFRIT